MNGSIDEGSAIDRRPIITCAGELEVFSVIEDNLSQVLPQDTCEWRRSLGRPVRQVHISATFSPFSAVALPKGNQWDLIRQPLFHVYWTECTDVDTYKATVRDDIESWLKELQSRDIPDFLIVVVESFDGKRANKLLPRTTVLDKIRSDFAPKQGDRCISVINPGKVEARLTDSWRGLVSRVRHLLLTAYARAFARLEDYVRQQRERRNEVGWNFMNYFHLQEELAQILEMLGLYDEALVQYDELDALFSQFVANGITGEAVSWLSDFQKPLEQWHGLRLNNTALKLSKSPSLLEFRAYLFSKQAQMLLLIKKVWEMASRCLPFLHTCTKELTILEVTYPAGAVSCWLFLAAMEVLQICDKFNHADAVEDYSLHTACLWAYASQKLRDLGELCGLMPNNTKTLPTSEQLHTVVGLSAGMGDNPGTSQCPSPTDKLKEALCSQDAFNKTYLELAELAMCTYKHIGRLRSARLIGREVASFYMLLGETQKAAAFLSDAVRTFEQDKWHELAAQTQIELVECYKKAQDIEKFVKTSCAIAAALEIDTLIRWTYFDEMKKSLDLLDNLLVVPFNDIIKIISISIKEDVIMQDCSINVELVIESNFPREFLCSKFAVSLEIDIKDKSKQEKYAKNNLLTDKDLKCKDPLLQQLKIIRHLDLKQDKQIASSSVVCKHVELKRKDSSFVSDFKYCLEISKLPSLITPGLNIIRLTKKATKIGKYYLGQILIQMNNLQLLSPLLTPKLLVEVKEEGPTLRLHKNEGVLLAGIEQVMSLIITIGSYSVDPKSTIKLTASHGLTIQIRPGEALTNTLDFEVGHRELFTSTKMALRVFADMLTKDHQVSINCPWTTKPIVVNLSFTPPLVTSWRLHTVEHRKFIQVNVAGQCDREISVEKPNLNVNDVNLIDNNYMSSQTIPVGLNVSYLWEIVPKGPEATIKAEFSLLYKLGEADDSKLYKYFFHVNDYQSYYILEANVEPTKGNEFCRVGILCHLHLTIKRAFLHEQNLVKSVMYEVLAEQSVWAVVGRTAGVISFDSDTEPQNVIVDVMPLTSGFLPLPLVQISKYIPADVDKPGKIDGHPRLEPFSPGQVYNRSKGRQVHVIAAVTDGHVT